MFFAAQKNKFSGDLNIFVVVVVVAFLCWCKGLHRTENIPSIWPEWADFQSCGVIFLVASALDLPSELRCSKRFRLGPHTLTTYVQSTLGAVPLPGKNLIICNRKHTCAHLGNRFEVKPSKQLTELQVLLNVFPRKANASPRLTYLGDKKPCCGRVFRTQDSVLPGMGTAGGLFPGSPHQQVQLFASLYYLLSAGGLLKQLSCMKVKERPNPCAFSSYTLLENLGFGRNSWSHLIL